MAELDTIASMAEIFGAATVLVGVAFALVQFAHLRRERRDRGAIEIIHSMVTPDFRTAVYTLYELPAGLTRAQIAERGKEAERAAYEVTFYFETMGVLVHERVVPLRVLDLVMGGFARDSWRKLRAYVEEQRAAYGAHNFAEWFQWLANQLEAHPTPGKEEGAHVAFANWRP